MINSSKINAIVAIFLLGFAILPGWLETFDVAPDSARETALLACTLFLAGLLIGSKLTHAPRPWTVNERRADRSDRGLRLFGFALLICTACVLVFGPPPPVFAAAEGFDALDTQLLREDAIKLNPNVLFVTLYSYTRDVFAPIVFVLAIEALARRGVGASTRLLWLAFLAAAVFIGIWSGQKATIVNYLLATLIFVARDARRLLLWLLIGAPVIAALTFLMFAITYPGIFDDSDQALANVLEGLVHRIYISPFEVSVAYVDAVDNALLIHPGSVIPFFGARLYPGPSIENLVGVQYFYSGIDSISANALCFAYAYVLGGLPMCLVSGMLTIFVLQRSANLVREGGNIFMWRAFQALVAYRLLDLMNGNFYSYLIGLVQLAVVAWLLARADLGRARRPRRPAALLAAS